MRPLEDVRILAVEQYGAGPWGSLHLSELGAEVIKIEDPSRGGDIGRHVPPYAKDGESLFFEAFNRSKLSISLDLQNADGRATFEALVRQADAVYSNLRGDVPAKLRLRYDDLKHLNPAIVCCSLSAFGMTGPRADQPGYDYMVQGLAGWMDLTGEPGGPPTKSGVSLVDFSGGFVAAISLLAALHAARRDGVGTDCDVSLYDAAISLLNYPAAWHLSRGFEPARVRHSAHPSIVPFQAFEAKDLWLIVACPKQKFWERLTAVIGDDALSNDPKFATMADRRENRDELVAILDGHFSARTRDEWLAALGDAGIPCAPVYDVATALRDPQVAARGLIVETEHPTLGTVRQVATAARVGHEPAAPRRAPRPGEHNESVLRRLLGYDAAQIDDLRSRGAFGQAEAR